MRMALAPGDLTSMPFATSHNKNESANAAEASAKMAHGSDLGFDPHHFVGVFRENCVVEHHIQILCLAPTVQPRREDAPSKAEM